VLLCWIFFTSFDERVGVPSSFCCSGKDSGRSCVVPFGPFLSSKQKTYMEDLHLQLPTVIIHARRSRRMRIGGEERKRAADRSLTWVTHMYVCIYYNIHAFIYYIHPRTRNTYDMGWWEPPVSKRKRLFQHCSRTLWILYPLDKFEERLREKERERERERCRDGFGDNPNTAIIHIVGGQLPSCIMCKCSREKERKPPLRNRCVSGW
jgi:hypothetical protein